MEESSAFEANTNGHRVHAEPTVDEATRVGDTSGLGQTDSAEPGPAMAAPVAASPEPETPPLRELAPTLTRLAVGLMVEGALELTQMLQQWESENPSGQRVARLLEDMTPTERVRFAAIGLAVESAQRAQHTAERVANTALSFGQGWVEAFRPIADSRLLAPVRRRAEAFSQQTDAAMQRWIETGQFEESHGRALARNTVSTIVDRVVGHLEHNDTTQALIEAQAGAYLDKLADDRKVQRVIEAQAGAYLQTLATDPARLDALVEQVAGRYLDQIMDNPDQVQSLIRQEAGRYLEYLQENPEPVQELVQGQSVSMAGEVLDEVRVRAVTVDTLMERLARGVLRRDSRAASAPPEVRELADYVASDAQMKRAQSRSADAGSQS